MTTQQEITIITNQFIQSLSSSINTIIFNNPVYLNHTIKNDETNTKQIINITLGYDIALLNDIKTIKTMFNIDEKEYMNKLANLIKRARTATLKQLERKCFLIFLAEKINNKNNTIKINIDSINYNTFLCSYNTNDNNIIYNFIMSFGDLEWMMFIKTPSNSHEDALYRTKLMQALFYIAFIKISYVDGIKDIFTNEIIIKNNIKDVIEYLNKCLDISLTLDDFKDYNTLLNVLQKELNKEQYNLLVRYYDEFIN